MPVCCSTRCASDTNVADVEPTSTMRSGLARRTTSTFAVLPRPVSLPSAGSDATASGRYAASSGRGARVQPMSFCGRNREQQHGRRRPGRRTRARRAAGSVIARPVASMIDVCAIATARAAQRNGYGERANHGGSNPYAANTRRPAGPTQVVDERCRGRRRVLARGDAVIGRDDEIGGKPDDAQLRVFAVRASSAFVQYVRNMSASPLPRRTRA